jgi:hypothetical protein
MTATSSTLGPAFPPARGTQGGALTVARTGGHLTKARRGTVHAVTVTGASLRQVNYWVINGHLGREHQDLGSGARREFSDSDLEVIAALAALASLGCTGQWLDVAADAVRASRVSVGEWLTVTLSAVTIRHTTAVALTTSGSPRWSIAMQAFTDGHPS